MKAKAGTYDRRGKGGKRSSAKMRMPRGLSANQQRHFKHLSSQPSFNADPLLVDSYLTTLRLHDEASDALKKEPAVVTSPQGAKVNPLFSVYEKANTRLLTLRALLIGSSSQANRPNGHAPAVSGGEMEALIDSQGD